MPPLRAAPALNVSRPCLPAPGAGDPLPGYPDIVLFEAVSRKGSAGCGGLSLRGGDAAYLVISLFVAPGPVETVPVSCPRLPRVLVAVELVAPFRRGQIWTFPTVTAGSAVSRRAHAPAPPRWGQSIRWSAPRLWSPQRPPRRGAWPPPLLLSSPRAARSDGH